MRTFVFTFSLVADCFPSMHPAGNSHARYAVEAAPFPALNVPCGPMEGQGAPGAFPSSVCPTQGNLYFPDGDSDLQSVQRILTQAIN